MVATPRISKRYMIWMSVVGIIFGFILVQIYSTNDAYGCVSVMKDAVLRDHLHLRSKNIENHYRKMNELPPGLSLEDFNEFWSSPHLQEIDVEQSVRGTCEKFTSLMTIPGARVYNNLYEHLLYSSNYQLIYCPVWKAMSTTWDGIFITLSKMDDEEEVVDRRLEGEEEGKSKRRREKKTQKVYEMSGNVKKTAKRSNHLPSGIGESRRLIRESCVFTVVRHPFQRLVSAFRDKMVARNATVRDYLFIRTLIKHRYRMDASNSSPLPTFSEFVNFVLDEWRSSDPRPGTWREWTRDWAPAYYLCAPCHIDYTHILRFEHYADDLEILKEKCELPREALEGTWYHRLGNTSSDEVEEQLFSQLTREQVLRLTQMYHVDLLMFGYDIKKYFNVAIV